MLKKVLSLGIVSMFVTTSVFAYCSNCDYSVAPENRMIIDNLAEVNVVDYTPTHFTTPYCNKKRYRPRARVQAPVRYSAPTNYNYQYKVNNGIFEK